MAFDIFSLSPTYQKEALKGTRARREMVVSYLDDRYRPDRSFEYMIERLSGAGHVKVSKTNIQNDIALYRTAYEYLIGDQELRARLEQRMKKTPPDPVTTGLRFLLADGIKSWNDIPKQKLAEYKAALEAKTQPKVQVSETQEDQGKANAPLAEMEQLSAVILEKFKALQAEKLALDLASQNQARDIELLSADNKRLRQHISDLQSQQARKALNDLDMLAQNIGDSELMGVIDKIRERLNGERGKQDQAKALDELPKRASFGGNVPVVPEASFLDDLAGLQPEERKQVVKSLVLLCNQGPKHSSLNTGIMKQRYRQTPIGASHIRASSELRVTWTLIPRLKVVLHNVFRRGDVGWSEA